MNRRTSYKRVPKDLSLLAFALLFGLAAAGYPTQDIPIPQDPNNRQVEPNSDTSSTQAGTALTYLADFSLTAKSVTPNPVSAGGLVSGSISGSWWTETGSEGALWYMVAGFRNSSGAWVGGDPAGVSGMQGRILSLYPGQSFSANTFSGLTAPTTSGTYTVWAQMVPVTTLSGAISAFKTQTATSEKQYHKQVGSVTVPPANGTHPADFLLTDKTVTPNPVSPGGSVSGSITGSWWTEVGSDSALWYMVAGFRDPNNGSWVGGEPVGVSGMQGEILPLYPGQSFSGNTFGGLTAPTTPGAYTVWAQMVPVTTLSGAISAFKTQTATSEKQYHKQVGSVTVPPSIIPDNDANTGAIGVNPLQPICPLASTAVFALTLVGLIRSRGLRDR
jgi:hypothetical protein